MNTALLLAVGALSEGDRVKKISEEKTNSDNLWVFVAVNYWKQTVEICI